MVLGNHMTRFKELARIEAAIDHRNTAELQWALGYCKARLSIAADKKTVKYWKKLERQIESSLAVLEPSR